MAKGSANKKKTITFEAVDKMTAKLSSMSSMVAKLEKASAKANDALKFIGATQALSLAGSIAGKAADFAKSSASYLINIGETKAHAIDVFSTLMGSADAGKKAFDEVTSVTNKMGKSPEDALKAMTTLMTAGFKFDEAMAVFLSAASFKQFNKDAKIEAIVKGFENMRNAVGGKMTMEGVTQLGKEAGLGVDRIMQAIGKGRGMNTAAKDFNTKLEDMIKTGKVTADEGMTAIAGVMGKLGGDTTTAGSGVTNRKDSTLSLWEKLQNAPSNLLFKLDVEGGPAQKALKAITDALDPTTESGQRLIKAMEGAIAKVGTLLEKMAKPENIAKFMDALVSLVEFIPDLVDAFVSVGSAIAFVWKLFSKFSDNFFVVAQALDEAWTDMGAVWRVVAVAMATAFAPIIAAVWAVVEAVKLAISWYDKAKAAITGNKYELGKAATATVVSPGLGAAAGMADGASFGDGMAKGLASKVPMTNEAALAMAAGVDEKIRTSLKIRSPSRVAFELGAYTGEGFGLGLSASMPDMPSILPASPGTSPPRPPTSGAPVYLTINVDGMKDGATPDDIANAVARVFAEMQ